MRSAQPPTRILFLIDSATGAGGAERLAINLICRLPRDRFEPWLCATRRSDATATRLLAEAGVRHFTLGRRTKWDVYRLAPLVRRLRAEQFDILHAHMFGSNVWGALLGRACGVPVVLAQEHGSAYEGETIRCWIDRNVVGRLATRFVAVSQFDSANMVSRQGVPADKIVVIPNCYVPGPEPSDTRVRASLGLADDVPVVAIAAVLRPEKRIDLLLRAHAHVRSAVPTAQLLIAGDGPCRETLEEQARTLGLDGSVRFLGARRDVDSLLRAADVGALSSDREGSPLLMFECMANDVPLVATAVGGVPEVIEHDRTGLLVPRRDPEALGEAITRLLLDPGLRQTLTTAARDRLRHYTADVIVARYVELYDALRQENALR